MAGDPTVMSYRVRDELGVEASTLAYIGYDGAVETVNALVGEWAAYGGLLDAAVSGQIVGGKITIPVAPDPSWKTAPAAGSRVEQTALMNYRTASSQKRQGLDIPALINTAIVAGKIVTASGPIHALITAVLAGFTNGYFQNGEGQILTTFADAAVTFRKHRRQLDKSTVYTD
jgi:hypothetical protein